MSSESHTALDGRNGPRETGVPLFADVESTLLSMQSIVGRKWQPIIVYHLLAEGPQGFSDLKSRIDGISSKMLSQSLDDLESTGLVTRRLLSDQPVRVEYALTAEGEALEPVVLGMVEWGAAHDVADDGNDEEAESADAETDGESDPADAETDGQDRSPPTRRVPGGRA